jgi:hypothetical protein
MNCKNVDFNSDVVAMYSKLRECLALAFDAEYSGPVDQLVQDSNELSKKEENVFKAKVATAKSLIKKR